MQRPQTYASSFPIGRLGRGLYLSPEGDAGSGGGKDEDDKAAKKFTQEEANSFAARERKNAEKEAEKHANKLKSVREKLGLTDEDDLDEALEKLAKANKKKGKDGKDDDDKPAGHSDDDVRKMIDKEAAKIRGEYEPKLEKLSKLESRVVDAEVMSEARKLGAVDEKDFAKALKGDIKYDPENDEFVIMGSDGKVRKGDRLQPLTIAEAVAEVAKEKPHWLNSKKIPGSGGGSDGKGNNGPVNFDDMSQADYEKGRKEKRW